MTCVEDIWPEWHTVERLGRGAFGMVWKASRTTLGHTSLAAVKIIDFPQDETEIAQLRAMGMSEGEIRSYLESLAGDVMREVATLDQLKGAPHVVGIDDYRLVEHQDGYAIGIRMELLEDLQAHYGRVGQPSQIEIARLGTHICQALEACHALGIIHRDIKPQNVFADSYGYLLGDFGIARHLEGGGSVLSQRGTRSYMAPEVFFGRPYGSSVDIYSLGLMMWRLLNGGVPPFIESTSRVSPAALQDADERRLRGEELPAPAGADLRLASIVLRACMPVPQDRWPSAQAMRQALEAWLDQAGEAPAGSAPAVEAPALVTTAAPDQPTDSASDAIRMREWIEETALVDSIASGAGATGNVSTSTGGWVAAEHTMLVDSVGGTSASSGGRYQEEVGHLYLGGEPTDGTAHQMSQTAAHNKPSQTPDQRQGSFGVEELPEELGSKRVSALTAEQSSLAGTESSPTTVEVNGLWKVAVFLLFAAGALLASIYVLSDWEYKPFFAFVPSLASLAIGCGLLAWSVLNQPKRYQDKNAHAAYSRKLLCYAMMPAVGWGIIPFLYFIGEELPRSQAPAQWVFNLTMCNIVNYPLVLLPTILFFLVVMDRMPQRRLGAWLVLAFSLLSAIAMMALAIYSVPHWEISQFYSFEVGIFLWFCDVSSVPAMCFCLGIGLFGWRIETERQRMGR